MASSNDTCHTEDTQGVFMSKICAKMKFLKLVQQFRWTCTGVTYSVTWLFLVVSCKQNLLIQSLEKELGREVAPGIKKRRLPQISTEKVQKSHNLKPVSCQLITIIITLLRCTKKDTIPYLWTTMCLWQ